MEAGAAQNYSISCTTGFGYSAQIETYVISSGRKEEVSDLHLCLSDSHK